MEALKCSTQPKSKKQLKLIAGNFRFLREDSEDGVSSMLEFNVRREELSIGAK